MGKCVGGDTFGYVLVTKLVTIGSATENVMHTAFSWLATIAGFISGALWLYAARIKVPTEIGSGYGALVGVKEMTEGFNKQASWNSYAAIATGAAALLQAVAMVLA